MAEKYQILTFALHGQHLNVGQVLMGAIQAGNDGFVSETGAKADPSSLALSLIPLALLRVNQGGGPAP
jgi:hypothetical protein